MWPKNVITQIFQRLYYLVFILAHTASHLRSQKDLCDRAFERRIDEVKNAKELLEKQLAETIVKIGEMEESIKSVERAISAKQVI